MLAIIVFPFPRAFTHPRFTSRVWQERFKLIDTQLRMSSTAHPQTNGQTKRVNQSLDDHVRCYVQAGQKDWVDHIDMLKKVCFVRYPTLFVYPRYN